MQRHHALIGLLAGLLVFGIQRDGAAAVVEHVDHFRQARTGPDFALHAGRGAQRQIALHFSHRHLHRPIAHDL